MQTIPLALQLGKPESARNPLLEAALEYAAQGWRVLPLHVPASKSCSCQNTACNSSGKHPRISNGLTGASSEASKIRDWWARWPDANIGIATGLESGVFVLDVDGAEGQASIGALGALPTTLRANTGRTGKRGERTGFHLYFIPPAGMNLRSNVGRLGRGLDIRAAGGYVVAPPSIHASGLCYEWTDDLPKIAEAPTWLIEMAIEADRGSTSALGTTFLYEGERDDRLFRRAARWRREGATKDVLMSRLRAENRNLCKPPLDDSQVLKIVTSAARIAVGSLDPLDAAWEKTKIEGHWYAYDKLLALIRHLESQRSGCSILLPVERIGKLIGCDRTLVGRHRKRAIAEGYIQEVERYIAHEKATRFKVLRLPPNLLSH